MRPGWAYGLYYAVIGALAVGQASLLLDAPFSPELTMSVFSAHVVTNFAAAPTVYRALRTWNGPKATGLRLRCLSSAGEPLTPEVNVWAPEALGALVHDHYGQTETGMLVNNHHHPRLRNALADGSMGRPMPGWAVAVLDPDEDVPAAPGTPGRIAVDRNASPLAWFSGYEGGAASDRFTPDGRWYLTGDTGIQDADGSFRFASRDDDVIIMAGYRIGPFEVESVVASHPAVAECAVIGVPDDARGEVVEAHVVLRADATASPELAAELQRLVKERLAAHAYPRRVHFIDELPKTPSGKIQRFVLRRRHRQEPTTPRS